MPNKRKRDFEQLSARERSVVGSPADFEWDRALTLDARERPASTQFSLRVDRELLESLQDLAREHSTTVSEVAREALERYVRHGGRPALANVQITFAKDAGMLVTVVGGQPEPSTNRHSGAPEWIPLPAR